MKLHDDTHDAIPDHDDDALRSLLREHAPEPPVDEVDWMALHARITRRAAPLLRHAPQPRAWWQFVAGWSGTGIPLATAAAAAALVLVFRYDAPAPVSPTMPAQSVAAAEHAEAYVTIEEALASTSPAFRAAGTDADAVIDALLFYSFEEDL